MRAYNWIMLMVMINAGMALTISMGIFGEPIADTNNGFVQMQQFLNQTFTVGNIKVMGLNIQPFEFKGVEALAILFVSASILMAFIPLPGSNAQTVSGLATSAFVAVFFGSWSITIMMFETLSPSIPQMDWFIGLYSLITIMVFIYALIQMHTGGAKSNV